MNYKNIVVFGFCFLTLTGFIDAENPTCEAEVACIDQVLSKAETEGFSGTILVVEGANILFQKGYGKTVLGGEEPITVETVFLIGSNVKDFTQLALFTLEDEGKISRQDALSKFFPGVPEDKQNITIQQLLDHTSGIPDLISGDGTVIEEYFVGYDYIHVTRDQMVGKTLKAPLLFTPGSEEVYSNSGFALLGAIIEIASGKSYEDYINEVVFQPAGMKHTGYVLPDWSQLTLARGINQGQDWGTPLDGERWMDDGPSWNLRGNGGMLGTVQDLYLFLRALGTEGVYPEKVVDAMIGDLPFSQTYQSRYFDGAGSNNIFNSVFVWMPDQDRGLVMISSNSEHKVVDYVFDLLPYVFIKAETE